MHFPTTVLIIFLTQLFLLFVHKSHANESRVLVIYTGGTIGMRPNHQFVYAPERYYLASVLRNNPTLNDKEAQEKYSGEGTKPNCLPPVRGINHRILYWVIEYENLLDSSDMSFEEWRLIAKDIHDNYADYDGFVVVHGTDTMAYTASALSFMLQNLGKPVVLTGSQIPIAETRSDALGNIVGSLIVAGSQDIPEVSVLFNNKLLRGNRCIKIDNHGLDAFDTPNLAPLATLDININVNEELIYRSGTIEKFSVQQMLNHHVVVLPIFPSIPIEAVRALLHPSIKGVVLQSYGSGNVPGKRADILAEIRRAVERGCIVVNVSQCVKGCVAADYENGKILIDIGVIIGSDITTEAALTKLVYVLAKDEWDSAKKAKMMSANLAGEMVLPKMNVLPDMDDFVLQLIKYLSANAHPQMSAVLLGALVFNRAQQNDVKNLKQLHLCGVNLHVKDHNGRTPLKVAAAVGNLEAVIYLLQRGANVHARDNDGENALVGAVRSRNLEIIEKIREAGGELHLDAAKIGTELCASALADDARAAIVAWHAAGADLSSANDKGDTPLHLAASNGHTEICAILLENGANPLKTNAFGKTPKEVAEKAMKERGGGSSQQQQHFHQIISLLDESVSKREGPSKQHHRKH